MIFPLCIYPYLHIIHCFIYQVLKSFVGGVSSIFFFSEFKQMDREG